MHESEKSEDFKENKPEADEVEDNPPAPPCVIDADRLYGPFDATQEDYFWATHPDGLLY